MFSTFGRVYNETSTFGRVYNETSTSEHVYNETSTSERVYNEKYPGYKGLNDYLKQYKTKSYRSFLLQCRDMIIDTIPVTSNWKELNNAWNARFMNEAQTSLNPEDFKILRDKGSLDQERNAKHLEKYWNKVIHECNIKSDILEYKREKERVTRMLFEIEEKIKMKENDLIKSSNEWKTLIKNGGSIEDSNDNDDGDDGYNDPNDNNDLCDNNDRNNIGDNNDIVDNNDFSDNNGFDENNVNENIDPQLPPPDTVTPLPDTATIMSSSQTPRHKLRKRKRVQANDLGVNNNHNDI